jgi:hypothetical protein
MLMFLHAANFDVETVFDSRPVNVTAIVGDTAMLPCSVQNIGKYKVWQANLNFILRLNGRKSDTRIRVSTTTIRNSYGTADVIFITRDLENGYGCESRGIESGVKIENVEVLVGFAASVSLLKVNA